MMAKPVGRDGAALGVDIDGKETGKGRSEMSSLGGSSDWDLSKAAEAGLANVWI